MNNNRMDNSLPYRITDALITAIFMAVVVALLGGWI